MFPVDRNVRFVVTLFFAMTLGAAALRWLEAPPQRWGANTLMMAESAERFDDLTFEVVPTGAAVMRDAFDCVIPPLPTSSEEAKCDSRGLRNFRIAILQDESGALTPYQVENILKVLGNLHLHGQISLENVFIDPNCDPRLNAEAPQAAHELLALLARKGIAR